MNKIYIYFIFTLFPVCITAQDILQKKLSCNFVNAPLDEFISSIEDQTNVKFFYKKQWIKKTRVSVHGNDMTLNEALNKAFKYKKFSFIFKEPNFVILISNEKFIAKLPKYELFKDSATETQTEQRGKDVMNKYLKGRKPDEKQIIVVGKKESYMNGNKVLITGRFVDIENGEPLVGATLFVEETGTGYSTDAGGIIDVKLKPGKYSVEIRCVGMSDYRCILDVRSEGKFTINMLRDVKSLQEVTIKAEQSYKIRGDEVGLDKITIKSIKELPSLMGEKDIIRIAQMLPGIVRISEGSSGINVRGGSADQNLFYINEVPLYNASHLFGFFTSINSAIITDFSIYKGHVPVKYGGRLSSVFNVETRKGNKNKIFAQGGISPITANLAIEGPIVKEKASFVVSGRSSYSNWILKRLPDENIRKSRASFYDLTASIDYEFTPDSRLNLFSYQSDDFFNLNDLNIYQYSNLGGGFNYFYRISPGLKLNVTGVASNYDIGTEDRNNLSEAYSHRYELKHKEMKASISWMASDKHTFQFGGNVIDYTIDRGKIRPAGVGSERTKSDLGIENGVESAIYFDDNFQITPKIKLYAGIRYSFYNYNGPNEVYLYKDDLPKAINNITDSVNYNSRDKIASYNRPELRFAVDFKTGKFSSLKLSYNEMVQYLFLLSNTYAVTPTDQWKLSDYHLKPSKSKQIAAGYYQTIISLGISVSSELYYKQSDNIVEFKDGADFVNIKQVETATLQGEQNAYGVEFMVVSDEGSLNGWISYAYSRSLMKIDGKYNWEKINEGKQYASNFDKPHIFNFVGNYRFSRRFVLSANIIYSTGRPITLPQSVYYYEGMQFVDYSSRNEFRIRDYFRTDLSLTFEGNLKANKPFHSYWTFNIYNLTGRKNPYTIYFISEEKRIQGFKYSIIGVPVFTISLNIKLGNYAND